MKIKKFNEKINDEIQIDIEFIKFCFVDFLDKGTNLVRPWATNNVVAMRIYLNNVNPKKNYLKSNNKIGNILSKNLDDYINIEKDNIKILENLRSSLVKLAEEYPDYLVSFQNLETRVDLVITNKSNN